MILSAIWNNKSKHEPVGRVQFVVFEKIYKGLFILNCLFENEIHEKIRDDQAEAASVYDAITEKLCHKLRHPGLAFDFACSLANRKAKIL